LNLSHFSGELRVLFPEDFEGVGDEELFSDEEANAVPDIEIGDEDNDADEAANNLFQAVDESELKTDLFGSPSASAYGASLSTPLAMSYQPQSYYSGSSEGFAMFGEAPKKSLPVDAAPSRYVEESYDGFYCFLLFVCLFVFVFFLFFFFLKF
jgi:hypothetical protein